MEKAKENDELNADYELPDGQEITIENERFRCPEGLFNPKMMGKHDIFLCFFWALELSNFDPTSELISIAQSICT